jgi:3-dehydroquinate synthase
VTTIPVQLERRSYDVVVGPGLLGRLGELPAVSSELRGRTTFAVTDRNVKSLYGPLLEAGLAQAGASLAGCAVLEPGEVHKDLSSLQTIWDALAEASFERSGCILALGGGVVGDVAGLAAATYHRGVDWIQLPTTLLAMADSSVGGKTAIDHPRGKNLIGAFHQPRVVVADLDVLRTLPEREVRSGFAEIIKAALLGDVSLFRLLEDAGPDLVGKPAELEGALAAAISVKAQIVQEDEREEGRRALLNLGHTLGHALEVAAGFGRYTHGEAVAVGLVFAARLSVARGLLRSEEAARILSLLERWGYPVKLPEIGAEKILSALRWDKKSKGGAPRWVLLREIGLAERGKEVPPQQIEDLLRGAW